MGNKERDLVELARFQLNALEACEQVGQLGQKLQTMADEASVSLRDDVSKVSLNRVEYLADKLVKISNHGRDEMTSALKKTRAEMEQWINM